MISALVASVLVFSIAWSVAKLAVRLLGWTLRAAFGILLLPFWLLAAVIGGLALALRILLPLALLGWVLSLVVPEG